MMDTCLKGRSYKREGVKVEGKQKDGGRGLTGLLTCPSLWDKSRSTFLQSKQHTQEFTLTLRMSVEY